MTGSPADRVKYCDEQCWQEGKCSGYCAGDGDPIASSEPVSAEDIAYVRSRLRRREYANGAPLALDYEAIRAFERIVAALASAHSEPDREPVSDRYDEGFDEGVAHVWEFVVCSVCGENHDMDESAACDGCEPVEFREWVDRQKAALASARGGDLA